MPGILTDQGEHRMLEIALGAGAPEALELRLFVNDVVPGLADTVASYVEMTTHGYAPVVVPSADWTVVAAVAGENTPARATAPLQTFLFNGLGAPVAVYGYLLVGVDTGKLWIAERFADGPYLIRNAGDQIQVGPLLRNRSEYP